MGLDSEHVAFILDLMKNDEMTAAQGCAAIKRLADHAYLIDATDEGKFRQLMQQVDPNGYRENYHLQWTKEDIFTLVSLRRSGMDFDQIARKLKRSTRGVKSRWTYEQMAQRQRQMDDANIPPINE